MIRYKQQHTIAQAPKEDGNNFLKSLRDVGAGVGYVGEKFAVGAVQGFESLADFVVGGIADLAGNEELAKQQFDNEWFEDWYEHPESWYKAEGGWKLAGDVSGALGSAAPGIAGTIAGAAITAASGGSAAPVGIKIMAASIGPTIAGLSAAGAAVKEAYEETGELGAKEYGYGAMVGTTEAALELATQGLEVGGGKLARSILKAGTGEVAEASAKQGVKYVVGKTVRHIGKDFVSEAVEEGLSEAVAPHYARLTYDPDAENATAEEIAYAAFIGGKDYKDMKERISTFLPQSSVVGMLLEHEEGYTVIKSRNSGLLQHNGFSWEVMGGKFIYLDSISENSKVLDKKMKSFLAGMTKEERENFVDSLFDALSTNTGAKTLTELSAEKLKLFKVWGTLDDTSKAQFRKIASIIMGKKRQEKKK